MQEPKYKDYVVLRVNFNTQKDVLRRFKAPVQSTLIVFRGDKELGRSVGETQEEWVDDLLAKGVEKGADTTWNVPRCAAIAACAPDPTEGCQ